VYPITTDSRSDHIASTARKSRRRLTGKDLKEDGCATRRVKQNLFIAEWNWKPCYKPCRDSPSHDRNSKQAPPENKPTTLLQHQS